MMVNDGDPRHGMLIVPDDGEDQQRATIAAGAAPERPRAVSGGPARRPEEMDPPAATNQHRISQTIDYYTNA
jgi:hypothetical protein